MSITFICPNCKRSLTVADNLAGKKGSCRNCKTPLTVPIPNSSAAPKPSMPDAPAVDVETAAAALFADEPRQEAPVDTRKIDFTCPFCDAQVQFGAEDAGKRAPCPECRRIVKVPELTKQQPKDWRKMDDGLPLGARRPDQPAPEGAWGSTAASAVSQQSLVAARAVPKGRQPMPTRRKVLWGAAAAGVLCLTGGGALIGYKWLARNREQQALQYVLDYAASDQARTQVGREGVAALHGLAGQFYLKSKRPGSAVPAREQLEKALALLTTSEGERDVVLLDLSTALVELGGDAAEVDNGSRLKWDEVHKELRAALMALRVPEARLEGLRIASRQLIAKGQPDRPEALAAALFMAPAERAEAQAVVGLELLAAGQKPRAEKAAAQALQVYAGEPETQPPLSAVVVALAVALNQQVPRPGKNAADEDAVVRGRAEGLAQLGQWAPARQQALQVANPEAKVRAFVTLAAAAVQAGAGGAEDAETALQLAETELKHRRDTGWLLLQLVQVASQAGVAPEKMQTVAASIAEPELRGRAQLAVLRARLERDKQVVEEAAADTVEPRTLAHLLARAYLARHNVHYSSDWIKVVQGWPEPQKAFGSAGVALALVGGE